MTLLKGFIRDEEGQDMVEYALLLGFIAIAVIVAVTALGTKISAMFANVTSKLT